MPEIPIETIQTNLQRLLPRTNARERLTKSLEQNGAGIEDAAIVVAEVLRFGQDDRIKLFAAEKVFEAYGLNQKEASGDLTINIISSGEVNLQSILNPTRE